jgi:hypothetical protein
MVVKNEADCLEEFTQANEVGMFKDFEGLRRCHRVETVQRLKRFP